MEAHYAALFLLIKPEEKKDNQLFMPGQVQNKTKITLLLNLEIAELILEDFHNIMRLVLEFIYIWLFI